MQIKLLVSMAGADVVWNPGDIIEMTDASECVRLFEAGFAEPAIETADPVAETATAPAPKKRARKDP